MSAGRANGMTKQSLLDLLTAERFGPHPDDNRSPSHPIWDDSALTTARRRRELDEALEGFDIPTEGPSHGPRITKEAS